MVEDLRRFLILLGLDIGAAKIVFRQEPKPSLVPRRPAQGASLLFHIAQIQDMLGRGSSSDPESERYPSALISLLSLIHAQVDLLHFGTGCVAGKPLQALFGCINFVQFQYLHAALLGLLLHEADPL